VLEAQAGDAAARESLIVALTPLIASVARIYGGSQCVNRAELMQEGAVGLLRALERFDPALGTPFWAYASWWVRQAMQDIVSQLSRPVVLSDRAVRQLARLKDAQHDRLQFTTRDPTAGELAGDTGLSRSQVENLLAAERHARALEEPVRGEGEGGATLGDQLADPHAEEAYENVPPLIEAHELAGLLAELSDRERAILAGRYGLAGPELTLRALGETFGVSIERVRQIEERALDKLRAAAVNERC
jgi:RNA polymerase sigma factor (sigma-70 family)